MTDADRLSAHDHGNCELCDWLEAKAEQELRTLREQRDVLRPPAEHYNRTLARAEHAEADLAALRAALVALRDQWRSTLSEKRARAIDATNSGAPWFAGNWTGHAEAAEHHADELDALLKEIP